MSELYKIEGKESLLKDTKTGSVINTDNNSYETARMFKKRILQEKNKQHELEERIKRLETIISKIKF
jgi:hypothetical protein